MADRKLRAGLALAGFAGLSITIILIVLELIKLPAMVLLVVFIVLSMLQVSLVPKTYKAIYESRLMDLPLWLRNRYLPIGFNRKEANNPNYDVLLLRPPSAVLSGPDCGEAMGLGYLANIIRRRGLRVLVMDSRLMGLDTMQTVELLMMYQTPMLGINLNFQYLAPSTEKLIASLRKRNYPSHITLGGLYASVAYEEILNRMPGVDTIVRFEGEQTYAELIGAIKQPDKWAQIQGLVFRQNGKLVINPLRPLIPDLNSLPQPARDFLPKVTELGGYAYVVSSRGCNGTCAYCVQQRSVSDPKGSRWRGRDPQEVVNEIQHLRKKYDIRKFSFVDDDFFGSKENGKTHAERVAEALIKRNLDISILLSVQPRDISMDVFTTLKKAGVNSVILAVDNFSQTVLDRYCKFTSVEENLRSISIMHQLGIDAYLGIIMFDPWTTLSELAENLEIMQNIPFFRPWQVLSKLEIYHGSPIALNLEKTGLIKWDEYSAKYDFLDPRIREVYLAFEIVMKILNPSMMELDGFRWGNLSYSTADAWILNNFKQELEDFTVNFNNKALGLAMRILEKQNSAQKPISSLKLADQSMQREAEILNQLTLRQLNDMRREAKDQNKKADLELVSGESVGS
jgi:radical SAM superfamily enzyme YgiQ (UPF0313 family)